jgi:hypothetical protein
MLATLRYTLILPSVLGIIYIGAFEGSRSWGDLFSLLTFGLIGWAMKQLRWPRPPLILGFVLGDIIERYMFISVERYGLSWMTRPVVVILFALAIFGLLRPLTQDVRHHGGLRKMLGDYGPPSFRMADLFTVFMICVLGVMVIEASQWSFGAKIVPMIVGLLALGFATLSLLNQIFRKPVLAGAEGDAQGAMTGRIHMDLASDTDDVPIPTILLRGAIFFGWLLAFMASMATIGLIPTVPLFVVAFMRIENREPWKLVIPQAVIMTLFIYLLFDQLLTIPWPQTLLGYLVPALKVIPSV